MLKMNVKCLLVFCLAVISSSTVLAADIPPQRQIAVTGDAEIMVVPDRAVIVLGVETWNKDLEKARGENDERIKHVIALLKQNQIAGNDIQTGYFTLQPTYDDRHVNPGIKVLTGYQVTKTMTITVKDLGVFEKMFSAIGKDGANMINGLEFKNTELRKYRDQARALAIRAAKEKAEALAKEIGQSIGKALAISEQSSSYWYRQNQARNMMQNVSLAHDSDEGTEGSIAPGKISVSAKVSVSFELL